MLLLQKRLNRLRSVPWTETSSAETGSSPIQCFGQPTALGRWRPRRSPPDSSSAGDRRRSPAARLRAAARRSRRRVGGHRYAGGADNFDQALPNRIPRVERGVGILKYHLRHPPHPGAIRRRHRGKVPGIDARDPRSRRWSVFPSPTRQQLRSSCPTSSPTNPTLSPDRNSMKPLSRPGSTGRVARQRSSAA